MHINRKTKQSFLISLCILLCLIICPISLYANESNSDEDSSIEMDEYQRQVIEYFTGQGNADKEEEEYSLAIYYGAVGEAVSQIQERLVLLGYMKDGVDGVYGKKTEAAVAAFQQEFGIEEAGISTETLKMLDLSDEILLYDIRYPMGELTDEMFADDLSYLNHGDIGRLYIPIVDIDVALYQASPYEYEYAQWRTDSEDSAVFYPEVINIIGDHSYQEFWYLPLVEEGNLAYIEDENGNVVDYLCVDCGFGKNLGEEICDQNQIPYYEWDCDLATYTCSSENDDIFIAKWIEVELEKEEETTEESEETEG